MTKVMTALHWHFFHRNHTLPISHWLVLISFANMSVWWYTSSSFVGSLCLSKIHTLYMQTILPVWHEQLWSWVWLRPASSSPLELSHFRGASNWKLIFFTKLIPKWMTENVISRWSDTMVHESATETGWEELTHLPTHLSYTFPVSLTTLA